MSDKILISYQYSNEEKAILASHFRTYKDWNKTVFESIKTNLISHLRIQQNNLCCYCKYPLGFDIKQVDIEHIIPKSEYSKFTFEPLNLAISCPACNTKKSKKPVLRSDIVNHPTNSDNYIIIHAHYDYYSHHIDILEGCVFIAKTLKGSETISYCELFRLSTVEERAKIFSQNTPSTLKQLVLDLKNGSEDEKKEFLDIIMKSI